MADRLEDEDDDWGGVAVKPAPDPKKETGGAEGAGATEA